MLLLRLAVLAAILGATSCQDRSTVSGGNSAISRKEIPAVPLRDAAQMAPFVATVTDVNIREIPRSSQQQALNGTKDLIKVAILKVRRADGSEIALTSIDATPREVHLVLSFRLNQEYRFPDALSMAGR